MDLTNRSINQRVAYLPLLPNVLYRTDARGLDYSRDITLFYNHNENKLIFDAPGYYTILLDRYAPPIQITVEPAENKSHELAHQLLRPHDFLLLEFGISENEATRAEAVSRLAELCEKAPQTQVGKWAGARLGLEFFEACAQRQAGVEPQHLARPFRLAQDELLAKARIYLARGYELKDEFPLREDVLDSLSRAESLAGNREKALSLVKELAVKYPFGKYGRVAARRTTQSPGREVE